MNKLPAASPRRHWGVRTLQVFLTGLGLLLILAGVLVQMGGLHAVLLPAASRWTGIPVMAHWSTGLRTAGAECALLGLLIGLAAALALPPWDRAIALVRGQRGRLAAGGAAVVVVIWLPVSLAGHSDRIAGERHFWLYEDAMISMRYADHLASGSGLVWNPGERVEGYTNFAWTAFMALVHLLPVPRSHTALVILLANATLAAALVPVLMWLVRLLGGETLCAFGVLAAYALNRNSIYWGTGGLETPLLSLLVALATGFVLEDAQRPRPRPSTFALIAALSLIRADGFVFSGLLYAVALALNADRRLTGLFILLSLLVPVAHEAFRLWYYGEVLPNTAYVKVANWSGRYAAGASYLGRFCINYPLVIAFALAGTANGSGRADAHCAARRCLVLVLVAYSAYLLYVGGDAFKEFRFYVPVLPILLPLGFLGIELLFRSPAARLAGALPALLTTPLIVPGYADFLWPNLFDSGNVRIGLLLKRNTPPACKVAGVYCGSVFYFAERYGIDMLGKSDRHVARLPVVPGALGIGHNKFDFDYSIGVLKPDIVVAPFKLPVRQEEMRKSVNGYMAFVGRLYFNRTFRDHCLPFPVPANTVHTLFVHDESVLRDRRDHWDTKVLDDVSRPGGNRGTQAEEKPLAR